MPITAPNQKVIRINRDMPKKDEGNFLLIKKTNLYNAYRDLNATALILYIYFAGNKDGYSFALSPKAINEEVCMPVSTCNDQVKVLISKGYLLVVVSDGDIGHSLRRFCHHKSIKNLLKFLPRFFVHETPFSGHKSDLIPSAKMAIQG